MTQQSTLDQVTKTTGTQVVHITDDKGQVDKDPVTLHKKLKEEVAWHADKADSTIDFTDGSPFSGPVSFPVPKGKSVPSGPVRDDAELKTYKYTVTGPSGPPNDPGVIIQN